TIAAIHHPRDRFPECRRDRSRSRARLEGPSELLEGHSKCCGRPPGQNAHWAVGVLMLAHTCRKERGCPRRDLRGGPSSPASHLPPWFFPAGNRCEKTLPSRFCPGRPAWKNEAQVARKVYSA